MNEMGDAAKCDRNLQESRLVLLVVVVVESK
jgi:hypothetical protein